MVAKTFGSYKQLLLVWVKKDSIICLVLVF